MHQPIQQVLRRMRRAPMFTLVTILTIAIGVGANSAIFGVINGILLKPLPYPEPDRLIALQETAPKIGLKQVDLSPSDYFIFREQNRSFTDMGIWSYGSVTVTGKGTPEQVRSRYVTEGTLGALGVSPALGRAFTSKDMDPTGPEFVILSYGYWQRKFGGDPSAVGRPITIDGQAKEIIGVLPEKFRFLDDNVDLYLPLRFKRAETTLGQYSFPGIARLKPGVTLAAANADISRLIPIAQASFPAPPGFSAKMFADADIRPASRSLSESVVGDLSKVLWVLMGSIGVVLLIACANVANLLLVRAEDRHQELAIRLALGASGRRIAGEMLSESLALAAFGGIAGLGLAWAALRLLVSIAPSYLPRLDNISVDLPVVLFTLFISLAAGLLFGLAPVIRYAAPNITTALRAGGRTLSQSRERHRVRSVLVVVQVTLACVLLISSGLMIRTFQSLRQVDPGFQAADLQTLRLFIPEATTKDAERTIRSYQDIQRKLSEIPGVTMAAFSNSVPTDGNHSTDVLYPKDRTYREGELPPLRRFKFVAPGFFGALGTRLIAGRDFTWTDLYDRHNVAIVSENMARELWRDPSTAIGKQVREGMNDPWREVVGVVADIRHDGADQKAPTTVYWPILMNNFWGNETYVERSAAFVVRTNRAGSTTLMDQVRQAVWSINPDLPLDRVRTMEETYRQSMARSSFAVVMLGIAGGMAFLLGVVGIYGVISYSVSQRMREFGIRIALGATNGAVQSMVVRQGVVLACVGMILGLAGAAALTRVMASLLFGVSPIDPVTYGTVSIGLLGAAAAASFIPARRASTVEPVEALRAE